MRKNNFYTISIVRFIRFLPHLFIAIMAFFQASNSSSAYAKTADEVMIDSVEIITENVFDLTNSRYDNFLFKTANKMHIVTKKSVVERELLLSKGDLFDTLLVNETVRNLRQLPFLLNTEIYLIKGKNGENIMVVKTSDKWTTVGGVSLHRTGGRSDIQIGIEENNLLGLGIFTSHDYFVLEDDRNFYQGEIRDSRFLGLNYSAGLFYSDNPRNSQTQISFNKPLYNLNQNWGWSFNYNLKRLRLDYYISEILAGRDRLDKKRFSSNFVFRRGPENLKYSFYSGYTYIDLKPRQRVAVSDSINFNGSILDPMDVLQLLPEIPKDTLSHTFEFGFRMQQVNFKTYHRINRFQKAEDINIGFDMLAMGNLAYESNFKRRLYQRLNLWPQITIGFNDGYFTAGSDLNIWFSEGAWIRKYMKHYFRWYYQYHSNHTLAINVNTVINHFQNRSLTLYLDEDRGLRGYPVFLLNGDSRFIVNIENRIFTDIEFLSVGLGGVVFADIGNIWTRETTFSTGDSKVSVGCGLRFGLSRSSQAEIVRFDIGYAIERKSVQISIGTGQYF